MTAGIVSAVPIRLYDTARREVVPFEPGHTVRMYVCGITPYDATHLGHAFTYLTYDLVTRRLEDLGHRVKMVRNFTDVDDSILPKARSLGVDFLELAEGEIHRFRDDMIALGTRAAAAEPRATHSIDEILEHIGRLASKGHTYSVDGTTYFSVETFPSFGSLSHLSPAEMIDLARERGGNPDDPRQRNPLDFVLWKPSIDDEPAWESPIGRGRPGWHIECSAMAHANLGNPLDLHGGGADLIYPHHECEIAQSEPVHGAPFVRHWSHVGMVAYHGSKMSKSLGNLVFVNVLRRSVDPRAIRLALLPHHYRPGFEWNDGEADKAMATLEPMVAATGRTGGPDPEPYVERIRAAIDDDLDTPTALGVLTDLAGAVATAPSGSSDRSAAHGLIEAGWLLGIDLRKPIRIGL